MHFAVLTFRCIKLEHKNAVCAMENIDHTFPTLQLLVKPQQLTSTLAFHVEAVLSLPRVKTCSEKIDRELRSRKEI